MTQLIRLVYASQSRSAIGNHQVDPALGSILSQSRRNNQKQAIGGVLFYGDGFFFQCLEGEKDRVEALYKRICADSRHHQARILSQEPIQHRLFEDWSMKFVPTADDVQALLRQQGYSVFNPFSFSKAFIDELVHFFHYAQLTVQLDPDPVSYQQQPAAHRQPSTLRGLWNWLSGRKAG